MSQRLVTPDVNSNVPDVYPTVNVISRPVGLGASGIVVIVGEADGGPCYTEDPINKNFFSPDQLSKVASKYVSGQIVDAFKALSAPSNDGDITGTANVIYIAKTNQSAKASAIVDSNYGIISDKNFGKPGNQYKYQITSIAAEVAPTVSGATIGAFGAPLNALVFAVRLNGGASATVTLSGTASDHNSIGTLITELNTLLPSGIVASPGSASNSLKLTITADNTAYRKGWGKSFELIDSTPGDLAAIGLVAGLTVSSQEPAVEVAISRSDIGLSQTLDITADVGLKIGYQGTTAVLSLDQTLKTLTTTVVAGSGANQTFDLTQFKTIGDLVNFISSKTGYSASASAAAQQLPTSALDEVTAQGFCSTVASLTPGRIKIAAFNFAKVLGTSALAFQPQSKAGLPNPMTTAAFLVGGARGGTLAADIVNVIAQLAGIQCNIIVPLFSRDASPDITDGLTASTSTYTIAAIHAGFKNHCIQYSTAKLKRNRLCILSIWDTYANSKAAAQNLGNFRANLCMQRPRQEDSQGLITKFLPWYTAAVAAGMQAGGFYKSITNKLANIIDFEDPSGFNSGSPGDCEDALSAGVMFLTANTAGNSWVSDQTTYGLDTNFVYNSMQAVYTSDIIALDLASSFKIAFIGKSLADVDQGTALSFLSQKMDGYKKLKLIAASSDAPAGWKNPKISILAPELDVAVEIKLATAIYFIPLSINISQVQG